MKKYKSKKGISLLIAIGSYGGFHSSKSGSAIHVCIAWIGLTLFFYDAENAMAQIIGKEDDRKKAITKLIKWSANQGYSSNSGDIKEIINLIDVK